MQFLVIFRLLLLAIMLLSAKSAQPYNPRLCAECEEEVWEEISCDDIPTTTSSTETPTTDTPTTSPTPPSTPPPSPTPSPSPTPIPTSSPTPPVPTTYAPTPTPTPASSPAYEKSYSTPPSESPSTETSPIPSYTPSLDPIDQYKKCYCDCKSGCKEFCRQVHHSSDVTKQITQLTKTLQPVPYGQIETKYLHERNWLPIAAAYNPESNSVHPRNQVPNLAYVEKKPAYSAVPQPEPQAYSPSLGVPSYQTHNELDSLGYSVEELTKLLHVDPAYPNPNVGPAYPQHSYNYPMPQLVRSPPSQKLPTYNHIPKYSEAVDAQTSATGGGSASAIATAPNKYTSSNANTYDNAPLVPYRKPAPPVAYPQKYASDPAQNTIPDVDATVENYLRSIIYTHQPRTRRYGYSL